METRQKIYHQLEALEITYQVSEHPPVYTVEEMQALALDRIGGIVKNLFLRDGKGKRHFLVMLDQTKKVNLKNLREKVGASGLRFASPERLSQYLGLEKGAVSPLGLLGGQGPEVEVIFDCDLAKHNLLGVHPGDNMATVWLSCPDLEKVVAHCGNPSQHLEL